MNPLFWFSRRMGRRAVSVAPQTEHTVKLGNLAPTVASHLRSEPA